MLMVDAPIKDAYQTPEAAAATVSYLKAMRCASDSAAAASFDHPAIDRYVKALDDGCATYFEEAIPHFAAVIGATHDLAREHIKAKMHIAADGVFLARLESGEYPSVDIDDPLGINNIAAAYVSCMRISLNRKMEGIHLGEKWILDFKGMQSQDILKAFSQFSRSECRNTSKKYNSTFELALKNENDKSIKKLILSNFSPVQIENFAIGSYVSVVSNDN